MPKHNPKNVRIIRQYLIYLEEAKRMNAATVDQVAATLALFQASTGYKDFGLFHIEQARKFKRDQEAATNATTGKPLSKATICSRLNALKAFFQWLAGQPGYKSKLTYSDADYFNPSNHDARIAKAANDKRIPTLEQVHYVLSVMPSTTDVEKRDRAVVAVALLSGARDNALASLRVGHVDLVRRRIDQDPRTVRTKFRKDIKCDFFPVGGDAETVLADYIHHMTKVLLYGANDPLFPKTLVRQDDDHKFQPVGLCRTGWTTAGPIRAIFKRAFEAAGLPYFNPHSIRDCLVNLGSDLCEKPEEFKAWSQNLGHDHVATTLRNYGSVTGDRQSQVMAELGKRREAQPSNGEPTAAEIAKVVAFFNRNASRGAGQIPG